MLRVALLQAAPLSLLPALAVVALQLSVSRLTTCSTAPPVLNDRAHPGHTR
jgi:hypothetical protein